jgi:uroporphyrin-3 C-methyltransferase
MSVRDTRQPLISAPAPARRSRWRLLKPLLSLAVLAAVGGLGAVAYQQSLQLHEAEAQLQALDTRLQRVDSNAAEQDRNRLEQQERLTTLKANVDRLNATLGGDQRLKWQLAEVNYYVHMAQQHLLLTHDVAGSQSLIDVAARIIADSNDNQLLSLRQALSSDQLALKLADHVDVAGTYLRLSALDQHMATLVLPMEAGGHRAEGVVQLPDAPAPTAASGWQARAGALMQQGLAKFRGLITVRHYDEPIKPLLSDAQRALITENLRLHLGQAQMALLRGDESIYAGSLKTAQADFARYYQLLPAAEFNGIQKELAELATLPVQPTMPAISAVAELDRLRADTAPTAAAASSGSLQ